jgi:hypothetical protein
MILFGGSLEVQSFSRLMATFPAPSFLLYKNYPQGDSNPCLSRERAMSWAARRWGPSRRVHARTSVRGCQAHPTGQHNGRMAAPIGPRRERQSASIKAVAAPTRVGKLVVTDVQRQQWTFLIPYSRVCQMPALASSNGSETACPAPILRVEAHHLEDGRWGWRTTVADAWCNEFAAASGRCCCSPTPQSCSREAAGRKREDRSPCYSCPIICSNSSSLRTLIPSAVALASLLPASAPATTKSVFFDTLLPALPPRSAMRFSMSARL